jgi:hypothetical protein
MQPVARRYTDRAIPIIIIIIIIIMLLSLALFGTS